MTSTPWTWACTSLRPEDTGHRRTCRNSNGEGVLPASPEVITSLISTLAVISAPAKEHSDDLPKAARPSNHKVDSNSLASTVDSGEERSTSLLRPGVSQISHGMYSDSSQSQRDVQVHPFDIAIPPIIRTSRPPSGLSPLTAPKRNSLNIRFRQIPLGQSAELPRSIKHMSMQTGQRSSSISLGMGANEENADLHEEQLQRRSLVLHSSKETIHNMDQARKRNSLVSVTRGNRVSTECRTSPEDPASPSLTIAACINPDVIPNSPLIPSRTSSTRRSRDKTTIINAYESGPGVTASPKMVPIRDSSLRHSFGSSSRTKERKSQVSEKQGTDDHQETLIAVGQAGSITAEKGSDDPAEDEVSKRIQELKAQRLLRNQQLTNEAVGPPPERIILHSNSLFLDPRSPLVELENTSASVDPTAPGMSEIRDSKPPTNQNHDPMSITDIENRQPSSPKYQPKHNSKVKVMTPPAIDRSLSVSKRSSIPRPKLVLRATNPETYRRSTSMPFSQAVRNSHYDDRPSAADSVDDAVDDYLSAPRLSQKVQHPQTGRIISFSEVGDPNGFTIFCCVGMGLTRYLTAFYDDLAVTLKLRLITPDRPGVGESEAYADGSDTPLGWSGDATFRTTYILFLLTRFTDDVLAICQHLQIARFSLLAHSAGAIYALATALRLPQYIRGRVHLLAPWIPPSQMLVIGTHQDALPVNAVPYSQRLLRSLPTAFLKAANSSFFSTTSASITTSLPKSPRRGQRKSLAQVGHGPTGTATPAMASYSRRASVSPHTPINPSRRNYFNKVIPEGEDNNLGAAGNSIDIRKDKERQTDYDLRLTHAIWELATTKANPAVDLLVCLERRQPIGFRYVDINKAVVIHHGTRDTRVPIENVKWLGTTMRKCEVRTLEGEGHGLMASAGVMGSVLMEMANEWEDWNRVVQGKKSHQKGPATAS